MTETPTMSMRERLALALISRVAEVAAGAPLYQPEAERVVDDLLAVLAEPSEGMQAAGRDELRQWLPRGEIAKPAANQWEPSNRIFAAMVAAIKEGK